MTELCWPLGQTLGHNPLNSGAMLTLVNIANTKKHLSRPWHVAKHFHSKPFVIGANVCIFVIGVKCTLHCLIDHRYNFLLECLTVASHTISMRAYYAGACQSAKLCFFTEVFKDVWMLTGRSSTTPQGMARHLKPMA
jgi:hypothetical protein